MKMKGIRCVCGKMAVPKEGFRFNGYTIDGWKCSSCGEAYLNPVKVEKILFLKRIEKLKYQVKVNKTRSNIIVRLPKDVSTALSLSDGDSLEVGMTEQGITLKPLRASGKELFY